MLRSEGKPFHRIWQIYQSILDRSSFFVKTRWLLFAVLVGVYVTRVVILGGFYVVSYALAIYLLNLVIGFLAPAMSDLENEDEDNPILPTREGDEYRPLIRKLPEFKFWLSSCRATVIASISTMFEAFDIPVFWPILVVYFIVLFLITTKRQIAHMLKHNYLPWDTGKRSFRHKNRS